MAIPQISTSNTFGQWLQTTQALVDKYNFVEDSANLVYNLANTVSNNTTIVINTSNFIQSYVNTAFNTANTAFNRANTVLILSQNSSNTANQALNVANDAYVLANLAFETSNTFFETIFSIQNTTDANTYYPTFVKNTAGVPEDVYVSSTKLSFNPSTGTLTTGNVTTGNVTTGNVTASGLVTAKDFNSTSDIDLKENIVPINDSLNILEKLNGIKFNWKDTKEISYGLSAQEVEKVLPEIVKTRDNGLKGVNYLNIIAILVESVKELKNEIEILKNNK